MWVTLAILPVAGVAVFASCKCELIQMWMTWVPILPVVGIPIWLASALRRAVDVGRPAEERHMRRSSSSRAAAAMVMTIGELHAGHCIDHH
jgi:hypothetical protein